MPVSESNIMRAMMLACSENGATVFRHNVGLGWSGRLISHTPEKTILANARPLHAGLQRGAGDIIGWKTVTITPDMVGKQIAVFASIEAKTKSGKPSQEQTNWIGAVRKAGGFAGIARDSDEAIQILNGF